MQVKLTLQVPKIIGPTSCSNGNGINRLSAYYNMCLLVTGEDIFQVQQKLLCHSCVAMYLTLTSSDETSEHVRILYSFIFLCHFFFFFYLFPPTFIIMFSILSAVFRNPSLYLKVTKFNEV